MTTKRVRGVLLALAGALLIVGGCGDSDDSGGEADGSTRPEGRYFGLVVAHEEDDQLVLRIEEAELLTGEEAVRAAQDDGELAPEEDSLPNDFYLRHGGEPAVAIPVADDATFTGSILLTQDSGATEMTRAEFITALSEAETTSDLGVPVWFEWDGERATAVEEQYLP